MSWPPVESNALMTLQRLAGMAAAWSTLHLSWCSLSSSLLLLSLSTSLLNPFQWRHLPLHNLNLNGNVSLSLGEGQGGVGVVQVQLKKGRNSGHGEGRRGGAEWAVIIFSSVLEVKQGLA